MVKILNVVIDSLHNFKKSASFTVPMLPMGTMLPMFQSQSESEVNKKKKTFHFPLMLLGPLEALHWSSTVSCRVNRQLQSFCLQYVSGLLKLIILFLVALGCHGCMQAFSSCNEQGLRSVEVQELPIPVASLVAGLVGSVVWCTGLVDPRHVGSSWTGGWTHIPWINIALAENFIQIFRYPGQFLANPIISLQCFAHLPVASSATQVLWVTCLYPRGTAFTMILMPRRWLFLLNKSNRAFVPRKCVSLCFVLVLVCKSVFLWLLTLSGLFRDFSVACCLDVLSSWSAFSWGALTTWSCPAACQHFGTDCRANGQC